MRKKIIWTAANKLSLILSFMFIISCLKLCAQTMSPAEAVLAREKFVDAAKILVGKPYLYGAVGPESFDCSGLIYYTARESVKVQLPRTAKAIYSYVRIVPEEQREIGDLLFFCTSSTETINHVGIYIGNNQFISAISDGENTGVIVSSLRQTYWKDKYRSTGQFLPSGKILDVIEESDSETFEEEVVLPESQTNSDGEKKVESNQSAGSNNKISVSKKASFADNLLFDSSVGIDWNLISKRQFAFKYRGIDAFLHARYAAWNLEPGFAFLFRFNYALDNFQLPIVLTLSANDFIRFYAGPVITFGDSYLPATEEKIKPSFFPGIIGASISTPALEFGKVKFQLVQDINYSVCNDVDGAALNFVDSVIAGLVMTTGIRVTFPLSLFF
ncbi:MAG: C40 family peptidase [Treponema sp.]|nr:C40 family peptidase [Treponema sp.]